LLVPSLHKLRVCQLKYCCRKMLSHVFKYRQNRLAAGAVVIHNVSRTLYSLTCFLSSEWSGWVRLPQKSVQRWTRPLSVRKCLQQLPSPIFFIFRLRIVSFSLKILRIIRHRYSFRRMVLLYIQISILKIRFHGTNFKSLYFRKCTAVCGT